MTSAIVTLLFALTSISLDTQAPPPTVPCVATEFAQFDFWVGQWDVFDPNGKQVGSSTINKTLDGCLVREEWRGAGGARGGSWNVFQRSNGLWHQVWIDIAGTVLHLQGRFENGAMQLSDASATAGKQQSINRITWTPNSDQTVRQLWEVSADQGKSWKVSFNGLYRRAAAAK